MPRVAPGECQACRQRFVIGERMRAVFTARVGNVTLDQLLVAREFAHVVCADPHLVEEVTMSYPVLTPRCNSATCVRCRKRFMPGDRFDIVYIVISAGLEEGIPGVRASSEFELAHVACPDPQLQGLVIGGVT